MTESHDHEHDHEHHHHTLSYEDAIAEFRQDKDEFFRTNRGSPIPEAEREGFDGPSLLPRRREPGRSTTSRSSRTRARSRSVRDPDVGRAPAPVTAGGRVPFPPRGRVRTADGLHLRAAAATSPCSCPSWTRRAARRPTAPVATWTSRSRRTAPTSVDFNLAYHPSCVYDAKFSCPLTPAENRLPVRIEAGERLAADHG